MSAAASATRASSIPRKASSPGSARTLRRPVRWVATRAESFLADNQARDHLTHAELALDADGHFLALHVQTFAGARRLPLDLRRRTFRARSTPPVRRRLPHAGDLRGGDRRASPTPRRPTPIAGPGGPRPATCSNGWPTVRPPSSVSTAPRSGGAISSRPPPCRTRRRSVRPTIAATSRKSSHACWSFRITPASPNAAPRRRAAASCAASAWPAMSNPRASRLRALPACSAPASASTRPHPSASGRTARCAPCSAPTITARAMPPPSRRSLRRGSACRSSASRSSRATPMTCRRAPAPSARARSRSAARRSTAPPTRSSPRAS